MRPLAAAIAVLLLSAHTASASHLRQASWYDDGPGFYGAVHSWRFGDTPYWVKVCRLDVRTRCVNVKVRDHMGNAHRAIDLSPAAFAKLAPLSRGVVGVSVTRLGVSRIGLPATDTAPGLRQILRVDRKLLASMAAFSIRRLVLVR